MFTHYIKTGIRNLRKNNQQVIISMTGLVIISATIGYRLLLIARTNPAEVIKTE